MTDIYTQFDREELNFVDPNKEYLCSQNTKSTGFTKLMKFCLIKGINLSLIKQELETCDINAQNNNGWTALMLACINSNTVSNNMIVKLLLDKGANPNLQNYKTGSTALMMTAVHSNDTSNNLTLQLLLKYNANIDSQDNNGWTALISAARFSNTISSIETIKILLKCNANIDSHTHHGWTALMSAVNHCNVNTVKVLLDHKPNINLKTMEGYTALNIAMASPKINFELVNLLKKYISEQEPIKQESPTFIVSDTPITVFGTIQEHMLKRPSMYNTDTKSIEKQPSIFTVSGKPTTSSGTLNMSLNSQTVNTTLTSKQDSRLFEIPFADFKNAIKNLTVFSRFINDGQVNTFLKKVFSTSNSYHIDIELKAALENTRYPITSKYSASLLVSYDDQLFTETDRKSLINWFKINKRDLQEKHLVLISWVAFWIKNYLNNAVKMTELFGLDTTEIKNIKFGEKQLEQLHNLGLENYLYVQTDEDKLKILNWAIEQRNFCPVGKDDIHMQQFYKFTQV